MAFDGKPIKNVSIVEFSIVNRTAKQAANAEVAFTIDEETAPILVSGGVIPPRGMSAIETVEELSSKDPKVKKYRLRVVPKQRDSEYFHAVFVFEGNKAPAMSVSSASGEVPIVPYREWKDTTVGVIAALMVLCGIIGVQLAFMTVVDYFWAPRKHKKQVERFVKHAEELASNGKLKSVDTTSLADAAQIYASYVRPKPSKFLSNFLPEQQFEY